MVIPNDGDRSFGPRDKPDKPGKPDKPDKPGKPGKPDKPDKPGPGRDRDQTDKPDRTEKTKDDKAEKERARAKEIKTATEINERTKEKSRNVESGTGRARAGETATERAEAKGASRAASRDTLDQRSNFDFGALDQRSTAKDQDREQEIFDRRIKEAVNYCSKNGDKTPSKESLKEFCIEKLGAQNGDRCEYESKIREGGVIDCRVAVGNKERVVEYKQGYNDRTGAFESVVRTTDKNGERTVPAGTAHEKDLTNLGLGKVDGLRPIPTEAPRQVSPTATQRVQIGTEAPSPRTKDPKPPAHLPAGPKTPPAPSSEKLPNVPVVDFSEPQKDQPEKKKSTPSRIPEDKPVPERSDQPQPEQSPGKPGVPGDPKTARPKETAPGAGPDAGDIAITTAADIANNAVKELLKFKSWKDINKIVPVLDVALGVANVIPITTIAVLEKTMGKPKSEKELKVFKDNMDKLKQLSTVKGLVKETVGSTVKELMKQNSSKQPERSAKPIPHKSFETDQNMTGPSPYGNQG